MSSSLNLLSGKFVEVKKEKRSNPEAAVGKEVDSYLKNIGCYARTIKSDGTKMAGGKWRKSSQGAGISDRIGVTIGGTFIAIELKAPGKKRTATDEQFKFLEAIIKNNGIACIADCVDDVKRAVIQTKEELLITLNNLRPQRRAAKENLEPLFP